MGTFDKLAKRAKRAKRCCQPAKGLRLEITWRSALAGSTALFIASLLTTTPAAQQPPPPAPPAAQPSEPGIPVTDGAVRKACGACHPANSQGLMSRISDRRTTPEGWELTIRRMVALNNVTLDPATARDVLRYLANNHGLAPEEAKPAAFESERRLIDFKYAASRDAEEVCTKCHSFGRVMLQRRTKEDWNLLINMHRGWYPLVDFQAYRRGGPPQREPGPDGRPPDNRHPVEKALEHLTSTFPLMTPEWAAWSATMRPPNVEGTWLLSGHETGNGSIYGRVTIAAGATPGEVTTDIAFIYARTGQVVARKGRGLIYTGFQWRGRSMAAGDDKTSLREVMSVDRDWQSIEGRWFAGGYDELGIDVRLRRASGQPTLLGVSRMMLRTGVPGQDVRLFGANLPGSLSPRDVDFGPGLTVTRVVSSSPDQALVTVDVAATAAAGPRDVVVAGSVRPATLVVADKVDYIKIAPEWAMARVGGVNFPKGLARFEAHGFHNGRDGKPNTKDDLDLGNVNVRWGLEEYSAVLNDEDLKYVGAINPETGVFTPNVEGPNPERPGNANNIGDVWVIATHTPDGARRPLRARAHLLVTVPLYMRWGFQTGTTP